MLYCSLCEIRYFMVLMPRLRDVRFNMQITDSVFHQTYLKSYQILTFLNLNNFAFVCFCYSLLFVYD